MGTRAAAFAAKIRNLHDYHHRIQHGILPLPSGIDVANTLKHFSQTLLSVLKDVSSIPFETIRSPEKDHARTSLFPSLDYKSLYYAVVDLVDSVPLVQYGAHALGQTILQTLTCLVFFLEHEYMDNLPYIVASSIAQFPATLHKDIIDCLCHHLLPFTISSVESNDPENSNYANMSTAAVLMMVFQYTDSSEYHCQLLECLMSLKRDIVKDLLCVIAHGTAKSRKPAAELLFHYWPTLNPTLADRKAMIAKYPGWKPTMCQRDNCLSAENNEAIKMCFYLTESLGSGDQFPPLFVCQECTDQIRRDRGSDNLVDLLLPIQEVSLTCQNKNCKSGEKTANVTCFSIGCASFNGHRPIRYCNQCSNQRHAAGTTGKHIFHSKLQSPWNLDPEMQSYMVEAIVSLLREAEPLQDKNSKDNSERHSRIGIFGVEESTEIETVEERQLLSRFGVWLVVTLCTPTPDTPVETLGRLLSMLFQWFHYTACLPDDQSGNSLERLKSEYIHAWLMDIVRTHFEVIVSCLVPHPAEYSQVGGHWDLWPSQTNQIREGFKRLLCLVPYDIITHEIWDYIMPFWMEAFRNELPEEELSEMKILLSKVLDPDLSPLGFDIKQMYHFLCVRFDNTTSAIQEQALYWLQTLTLLEVPVPLNLLFDMFNKGIISTSQSDESRSASAKATLKVGKKESLCTLPDAELNLTCFILMLDILIKQIELQEIPTHKGLDKPEAQQVLSIMRDMLKAPWVGVHSCNDPSTAEKTSCLFCEMNAVWYQLAFLLMEYFCPVMEVTMADIPTNSPHVKHLQQGSSPKFRGSQDSSVRDHHSLQSLRQSSGGKIGGHRSFGGGPLDIQLQELHKVEEEVLNKDPSLDGGTGSLQKATVKECDGQLDTVAIMPTEQVVTAFARAVTLTEDDLALAKCTVASATLVDENDQAVQHPLVKEDQTFWHTSQGNFKFTIEELPVQLQLIHIYLMELSTHKDADVLYHLLLLLKLMCLHAEVLNKAARDHRGFLIWCQENLLVSSLWELLQAEFSQISQLCVPLLLHCVTLPCGSDMFWKVVEQNFHNDNWRARYAAVERVTMIAQFVDAATVKNSPLLQTSLANAFCYLVRCLDDIKSTIAQRALLNLENIKASSLKLLVWCLEAQFDVVILDRPMILQTVYQLYNHLSTRRFLTWDFFLNRFDTLYLEAQVNLERAGETNITRDLKNSNLNSEMFQRKVTRAHEALALTHSSRSLAASLGTKWPYKRAMSAPGGMLSKQDKLEKEKVYSRQSSAPVLKRKSSKLSGGLFSGGPSVQHFPNSFFPDGHLREMVQEESHQIHILHRVMEMEDHDKDTLHLLIFLLMQFLSRPDLSHPTEEKAMARNQHIVLRHLNMLLGYSPSEKGFLISPFRLRSSPVFNAFMAMMAKVLDFNFKMGNMLLNIFLPVLIFCPSPQRYSGEHQSPTYSLWLLLPHVRNSWLMAVLVILYKYQYTSSPVSRQVQMLVHIVLNTLEAHCHRCKHVPEPLLSPVPSRSRDLSTASVDLENIHERQTPPSDAIGSFNEFKFIIGDTAVDSRMLFQKSVLKDTEISDIDSLKDQLNRTPKEIQQWKTRKLAEFSCSSDGEDIEPELEAIPESPKSESSDLDKSDLDKSESVGELELANGMAPAIEQAHVRVVKNVTPGLEKITAVEPPNKISTDSAVVVDSKTKVQGLMENQLMSFNSSYATITADAISKATHQDEVPAHKSKTAEPINTTKVKGIHCGESEDPTKQLKNYVNQLSVQKAKSEEIADTAFVEMEGNQLSFATDQLKKTSVSSNMKTTDSVSGSHKPFVRSTSLAYAKTSTVEKLCEPITKEMKNLREACKVSGKDSSCIVKPSLRPVDSDSVVHCKRDGNTSGKPAPLGAEALPKPSTGSLDSQISSCTKQQSFSPETGRPKHKIQRVGAMDGSIKFKPIKPFVAGDSKLEESFAQAQASCERDSTGKTQQNRKALTSTVKEDATQVEPPLQISLEPYIMKPTPERLLPIGPVRKDSKKGRNQELSVKRVERGSLEDLIDEPPPKVESANVSVHYHSTPGPEKSVQTSKNIQTKIDGLEIPAQERLLPVGPIPQRKDGEIAQRLQMSPRKMYTAKLSSPIKTLQEIGKQASINQTEQDGLKEPPVSHMLKATRFPNQRSYDDFTQDIESSPSDADLTSLTSQSRTSKASGSKLSNNTLSSADTLGSSLAKASHVKDEDTNTLHGVTMAFDSDIPDKGSYSTNTSSSVSKEGDQASKSISGKKEPSNASTASNGKPVPKTQAPSESDSKFEAAIVKAETEQEYPEHQQLEQQNSGGSAETQCVEKLEGIDSREDEETTQQILEQETPSDEIRSRLPYRQRKQRRSGLGSGELQKSLDIRSGAARRARKGLELAGSVVGSMGSMGPVSKRSSTSQSGSSGPRFPEDQVVEHCNDCGALVEEYSDEELGLCIVVLGTFVHREPALAAPLLPEMLRAVARIAASTFYPWQSESNIYLPGGATSVARQYLRCILHQLTPNGIFIQIFSSHCGDVEFFKTIAAALADFADLNQVSPLILLFENLNERKHLSQEVMLCMENVATYMECLPLESNFSPWATFLPPLEAFLRKLLLTLPPSPCDLTSLLRIITCILKMPIINSCKSILDPFSKILSYSIHHSPIQYQQILEMCHLCNRNLSRERDKQTLSRTAVFELVQMIRFKTLISDEAVLILLQDAGGTLVPTVIVENLPPPSELQMMYNTGAGECMRQNLNDALEFVADVHTLSRIKSNFHGTFIRLNEETLGGQLKAGIAQYLALEITKGNGRDNRAIGKYLPWLYNPPTSLQQGPKEFIECVSHIRLLSWLLLGALQHSALLHNVANFVCQPIPIEANSHIAEHIQVILAGFAEQSKATVFHMSSLFHAFILCQLWTMYCEHMVTLNPPGSEQNYQFSLTLTDFWARVTPAILQLICHSRVLAETVSLHFLSLIEALMECNSTVLARLMPMWTPVLYSYHGRLPGHLQVRLQSCLNWQPPAQTKEEATSITTTFLKWLQRLQFKLSQIELQSSAATQFYSV